MRTGKRLLCLCIAVVVAIVPYVLVTASASSWWQPTSSASISWNWQLQGTVPTNTNVQMFDIDGFDNTATTVAALHAQGTIVVCYLSLGTWENWRADAAAFPASVLGGANGWPGEKWLDIRQISVLAPIMTARMQMCRDKGFDAIEPDNIDGYTNKTGFPLTAQDQVAYNTWIAGEAHTLGLSVGLKNDIDQAAQLAPSFDWALNEQCNQYGECGTEQPFINAGKAVFNAEYGNTTSFCSADIAAHINGVRFDLNLDGKTYAPCAGWTPPTTTSTATTTTTTTTTLDPATSSTFDPSTSSTVDPASDSTTSSTVDPASDSTTSSVPDSSTSSTSSTTTTSTTTTTTSTTSTTRPPSTTTTRRATTTTRRTTTTTTTTRRRGR